MNFSDEVLYLDSNEFFGHLSLYDYVDVLTYTYGRNPLLNLRKVVANIVVETEQHLCKAEKVRKHGNLHTKLFLAYKYNKLSSVFLGSLNCRLGLNHNIMICVPAKYHKQLVNYFNEIWKEAK